ncbi:MAG: ATP-binding protein [Methanomassiliicoccus sp.]|nr:ATP-binding protein [Methanomassiliicoccus sp.]
MKRPVRQVAVLSGKGGTGKTTVTASLACYAGRPIVADCDVDASNLSLLLQGTPRSRHPFIGGLKADIDPARCTSCGKCEDHCRFRAIRSMKVDHMACEGCGVCQLVCPEGAAVLHETVSGEIFVRDTSHGTVVDAEMMPGEPNSGKLAARVRTLAMEEAKIQDSPLVLIDGPPGTGCPAISSVIGVDLALIVTEPTRSGGHDLGRVIDLASHFNTPCAVIINKHDLNPDLTIEIIHECQRRGVQIMGLLPFDEQAGEAIISGLPLPESAPDSPAEMAVRAVWEKVLAFLEGIPDGPSITVR